MTIMDLMKLVVEHLAGWEWKGEEGSQYWSLFHTRTGARVAVHPDRDWKDINPGRIELYPRWPEVRGHYFEPMKALRKSFKITVSASRSPEAISHDIQRRLLAFYPGEYTAQLQRKRIDLKARADAEHLASTLAEVLGGRVSGQRADKDVFSVATPSLDLVLRVEMSDAITFERLTVSKSLGIDLVDFLRRQLQVAGEI